MNSRLISARAFAGIALTVLGAAPASASTFTGTIGFTSDGPVNPGDSVDITGTCDDPTFTTSPVISDVLDAPDLVGTADGNGGFGLRSNATVKEDAPLGSWPVAYLCGDTTVSLDLLIEEPAAEEPGTLEISPNVVKPDEKVTLSATCGDPEFSLPTGFESYDLEPSAVVTGDKDVDGVWRLTGTTTVKKDAAPGKGSVLFQCGPNGNVIVAEFTIVAADAPPPAQVPVKPKGAADTGSRDPASESGSDTGLIALGALVVAGGGIGAAAYRRRQRG